MRRVALGTSRITGRYTYLAGQSPYIPTRANIPHARTLRRLCPLANHANEEFVSPALVVRSPAAPLRSRLEPCSPAALDC